MPTEDTPQKSGKLIPLIALDNLKAGETKGIEIELVDDANKQLMKWPMAASGASISPEQEMVYKTRLIEPPADFKNIRVTMKK